MSGAGADRAGPLARVEVLLLAGALVLSGLLRFVALGARGWWQDEAVTVELVRLPFVTMLRTIPDSEGSPPLYYVLAWGWTRLFGDSEIGLRSLSATFGLVTVFVVFLAGRELVSTRAGLVTAFLAAASPLLVWHAQDGRAYSLLVLLAALSFLFFVRVLRTSSTADAVGFTVASSLALLTHYFAIYIVAPEAVWLLAAKRTRRLAIAPVVVIGLVGVALLPLIESQRGNVSWIAEVSRTRRVIEVAQEFLVGPQAPWERPTTVLAGLLASAAIALFAWRGTREEWRTLLPGLVVGLTAIAAPLVLAIGGVDYVLGRNLMVAWVPMAIVVAAGLSARRAGIAGLGLAVAIVALGTAVIAVSASQPKFGAEDWRGAARALGPPPPGGRALVVWPDAGREPFLVYRPEARGLPGQGASASEVVVVTLGPRRQEESLLEALSPPRPFGRIERDDERYFTLVRFDSGNPVPITPASLLPRRRGGPNPALLYER